MIYDCFTFFNELDLLEIRLNVLDKVVDKFVLVEATKTFTNKDKELFFEKNKERFSKFKDKIIHIIVNEYPESNNPWEFEYNQRRKIAEGLVNCNDDDLIVISDVDEIPNPKAIKKIYIGQVEKTLKFVNVFNLQQRMFNYYINFSDIKNPYWDILSPKVLTYAKFKELGSDAEKVRHTKGVLIRNGGWHFSYLGGIDKVVYKIQSFSHQELNNDKIDDAKVLKDKVNSGFDIYSDKLQKIYLSTSLDNSFPEYILKNKDKYSDLIKTAEKSLYCNLQLNFNKIRMNLVNTLKFVKYKYITKDIK